MATNKRIVFFDSAPGYNCVRILVPVGDYQKDIPPTAQQVREVDVSALPIDRTFRNAWKADLTVDMPKAREIWRDRIRLYRGPKFEPLDVAWFKAVESNDVVAMTDIKAKKKALRDAPQDPRIEAAKTPEDLKKVWPL